MTAEEFAMRKKEALKTHDVEKYREFYKLALKKKLFRGYLPGKEGLEVLMNQQIYADATFTDEEREEARLWLWMNGHKFSPIEG